ncbi:MAG: hypothetical protein OEY79_04735, partial [Anaplasmataceae bacterium]|nr:hypothetical protein [Anaplasmataceae bacterium]
MLSPTMNSSLRGMQAAEYALMIRSNNVANANNKDYQRLEAETFNDVNRGVDVSVVRQQIDEYTELERYKYTSLFNYYETKSEIYDKIDLLIGKPSVLWDKDYITNSQNIVETVENFFESLERFSMEPELTINKTEFIEKAKILTNDLQTLAENFSQLRLDIDQQIFESLAKISSDLDFVYKINKDLNTKLGNNKNEAPELMMKQNKILNDLSEYMDMKYSRNNKHQITIQDNLSTILANEFSSGIFHYHPWNNKGYIGSDDVFHEITFLS